MSLCGSGLFPHQSYNGSAWLQAPITEQLEIRQIFMDIRLTNSGIGSDMNEEISTDLDPLTQLRTYLARPELPIDSRLPRAASAR